MVDEQPESVPAEPSKEQRRRSRIAQVTGGVLGVLLFFVAPAFGWYSWTWERVSLLWDPGRGLPLEEELAGQVGWQANWPGTGDSDMQLLGSWLDSGVLVWGGYHQLTGYDATTGEVLWELDQGKGGVFCGMSPEADTGRGVVMAQRTVEVAGEQHKSCDQAILVETDSGRELWRTRADPADDRLPDSVQPVLTSEAALVPGPGGFYALDPEDGTELWRTEDQEWLGGDPDSCEATVRPRGGAALVLGFCRYSDDPSEFFLAEVDPRGGDIGWIETIPGDLVGDAPTFDDWYLAATEPITLLRTVPGNPAGLVFDGSGAVKSQIPADGESGTYTLDPAFFGNYLGEPQPGHLGSRAVVHDGTVYTATEDDTGQPHDEQRHGIAAVDLATGEELWAQRLSAQRQAVPVAVEGGRLIALAYRNENGDEHTTYEVVAFDLADTGEPVVLGPGTEVTGDDKVARNLLAYWQDGQMLLLPSGEGGNEPGDGAVTVLE